MGGRRSAQQKRWAKVESRFDPYAIQSGCCCLGLSCQHHWWQVKPWPPPPPPHTHLPDPCCSQLVSPLVNLAIRPNSSLHPSLYFLSYSRLEESERQRFLEKLNLFFFSQNLISSHLDSYLLKVFDLSLLLFLSLSIKILFFYPFLYCLFIELLLCAGTVFFPRSSN